MNIMQARGGGAIHSKKERYNTINAGGVNKLGGIIICR